MLQRHLDGYLEWQGVRNTLRLQGFNACPNQQTGMKRKRQQDGYTKVHLDL